MTLSGAVEDKETRKKQEGPQKQAIGIKMVGRYRVRWRIRKEGTNMNG